MADHSGPSARVSWQDAFWSTLVVGAGWALAMGIPTLDSLDRSGFGDSPWLPLMGGPAISGTAIGVAQWIVTTRRFSASAWWVVAYSLGWAAGVWSGFHWGFLVPNPLAMGAVGGASVGILQAITLRHHLGNVGAWVVASTLISMAGCWLGVWAGSLAYDHGIGEPSAYLIGGATAGLIIGFLTSAFLRWLAGRGHSATHVQ